MDITLNRESEQPLYMQIRDAVALAVKDGGLKPGDRLPPVTVFAKDLGVTQATIRRALEDLTESGVVESHVGRGTFIRQAAPESETRPPAPAPGRQPRRADDSEFIAAARQYRTGIAKSLDALMPLARRPGLIQFTSGVPDVSLIRDGLLTELTHKALEKGEDAFREYGDPMGFYPLRKALAERFSKTGADVTPAHIMLTNGSQQAVALMGQFALDRNRRVICETPCYMGIANAFAALGHWVEGLPRDRQGPLPEKLERLGGGGPSVLYLCPILHNPMGTDLSPARKRMVLDWIEAHDGVLISDEVYYDLHPDKPESIGLLPEIGRRNVVVAGSLSKSFMCGLRVGWLMADPEMIKSLVALKQTMDLGSPPLMHGVALALLASGIYDAHLDHVRAAYGERRDAAVNALEQCMPDGVTWTAPRGGFHLWAELPEGYSAVALFLSAAERGAAVIPGPCMDVDHRFGNAFRISYALLGPDQIREGIELLAGAVRDLLGRPPDDQGLSGIGHYL